MESILSLFGLAVAALLVVAIAVARWEQTGTRATARRSLRASPRQAVSVDVHLDEPAGEPTQRASDQAARQAALGKAMARMARASQASTSLAWIDTQPNVAGSRHHGNTHPSPGSESRTGH